MVDFTQGVEKTLTKFHPNILEEIYMNLTNRKKALQMFTYGAYVITSKHGDDYCASTVTWVSQASFEPPMISVCIKKESHTYDVIKSRGEFILHILSHEQKDFAATFFKQAELSGNTLNGKIFKLDEDLPVFADIPAYLKCKVLDVNEIGDHPLFLSEVVDAHHENNVLPLELRKTGWKYGG